jgi:hypothetical protein
LVNETVTGCAGVVVMPDCARATAEKMSKARRCFMGVSYLEQTSDTLPLCGAAKLTVTAVAPV